MTNEHIWIAFGLTGQLLFTGRFVVQWLSSEREKKSVVPPLFWYFSIGGALVLLAYAIHQRDIVFTLGQSTGLFIYGRNLQLIHNEKRRIAAAAAAAAQPAPRSEIVQVSATVRERKAA